MNDFGPKRPMSESAETAPTDTAKAKRGRPKKKPDYDRENVRKKACTRLTCSRICDILESWETVALAALIIANLYTVSSRQQSKDRLRCEEEYNGLKYMKNIDGRCEAAEVAALCLANLYNSGGHRKITPDEYETIKKYLQKFPESMHIRAAFIIASEAIYSPSAEYKRVPDKIINKAKQWSEQYPKKIEFQEAYFGLLFSRLKYAQAQDMRNEQRRVYREMKTVAERANYSEYNESNQLMESVDILHRVFGY